MPYAILSVEASMNGPFLDVLSSNIRNGQLYSNLRQIENGRLFQTTSLFMFGMLLGRRQYFINCDRSVRIWKRILTWSIAAYVPLFILRLYVPEYITHPSILTSYNIAIPSLANFAFMAILVQLFTLFRFKKGEGYQWQKFIIPYGRMSLTNYITQSIIGVCIYYGFGLGLYKLIGATATLAIGLLLFFVQWTFSRYWLERHKQGPPEYLWRQGTWMKI